MLIPETQTLFKLLIIVVTRSVAYQHDPINVVSCVTNSLHPWFSRGILKVSPWYHQGILVVDPRGYPVAFHRFTLTLPTLQPVVPRFDPLDPNMVSGV